MNNDNDAIIVSQPDKSTVIATSIGDHYNRMIERALSVFDSNTLLYSANLNDNGSSNTLSQSTIESLGEGAQTNLQNLMQINATIRKYVNVDDLIGMVVQSISNNINTDYRLSFKNFGEARNKVKTLEKARAVINDFNEQVNLKQYIRDSILIAYLEGNYASELRNLNDNWQIDYLPLTIIEASGYEQNGNPVLLINVDNLKTALSKTMLKDKKGNPLFFKTVDDEIKNNYPESVYNAYANKEKYAVLDASTTGMCRINNFGRKYGLSPIFRALSPTIMLKEFQNADSSSAKSKAKKIIHQKLREKCLGDTGEAMKSYGDMAYAHTQLMSAWKNKTVIYTSSAAVESVEYIEPKTDDISVDKINIYRNKVLSSLGVAFLAADKSQTASTANINLSQLLKCINSISEQVEVIIKRFYRYVLEANGIGAEYCPNIKVIDSELLEMDMRIELSKLLYATFACSRDTAFNLVGIDIEDEKAKREQEEKDGLSDIFVPYTTAYNTKAYPTKGDTTVGRPADSNDSDKQGYDEDYNKTR